MFWCPWLQTFLKATSSWTSACGLGWPVSMTKETQSMMCLICGLPHWMRMVKESYGCLTRCQTKSDEVTKDLFFYLVYFSLFSQRKSWDERSMVGAQVLFYYTASSVSRQNDPNTALWLATRWSKMALPWPLGTTRCVLQEKCPQSHLINPLFTRLVWSKWVAVGLVLSLKFIDLDSVSVHKRAELGQSSRLINE